MKRLLSVLIIALFSIGCLCMPVFAAGTCELTQVGSQPGSDRMWRQYTCTADAADGSVPAHTIVGFNDFYIYSIETWPGGTTPTDDTDFTLIDATTGEDMLGGNGTDAIDATTPKTISPRSAAMNMNFGHMVKGNLTLNVTGNSVNSAVMNIRITGIKSGPPGSPQGPYVVTEVQGSKTVTNSSTEIAAADPLGRNVFVQNNDAAGIVYLNLSGAAVADGTMITLDPKDSITFGNITNAIQAIGSIASNANVVVVED